MKEFLATIELAYKEIEVILRLLGGSGAKVHPKIDAPPQPPDVNDVVTVPLTIGVQKKEKEKLDLTKEIIIGDKENPRVKIITNFSPLDSSPFQDFLKFLAEKKWETLAILIGGIGSIYGAFYTLAFHNKNLSFEWYYHIEFVALGIIPAVLDLCYKASSRKNNELKADQEEKSSVEAKLPENNVPKEISNNENSNSSCPLANHLSRST